MNSFNIEQAFADSLRHIVDFLPQLLAALLILLIGYLISKGVSKIVQQSLRRLRFDRALHNSSAGNIISRMVDSPSGFVGKIVFWLLYLLAISLAISALNLPVLNQILNTIYAYIPNVIAAVIIFLVASTVSAGAAKFVARVMERTATAKLIAAAVPTVVMSLAVFMILNQLGIARDIVNILFTAIVGAAALGFALAFGLGGRDVARNLLDQAVDTARARTDEMKAAATTVKSESNRLKNS
jgi:small-conductance mechanosensitive channel